MYWIFFVSNSTYLKIPQLPRNSCINVTKVFYMKWYHRKYTDFCKQNHFSLIIYLGIKKRCQENSHMENSYQSNSPLWIFHPENSHLEYSRPYIYHSLILRLLCNSFLKVLKSEIQKSMYQKIFSLPAKMVTYSKKLCWSSLIIGYYYHPPVCFECFCLWNFSWGMWCYWINQLNLNSFFPSGY